jgi:3-hydroxybutyryl-CoA dehydrogenase
MVDNLKAAEINIGVVGLGLMGSSIVVALLVSNHPVVAIAPVRGEGQKAGLQINLQLQHCEESGLLHHPIDYYINNLTISEDYGLLSCCRMVLECVIENPEIKKQVYAKIGQAVSNDAVITSNTSAIPISILQKFVPNPDRFLGIHWAEPAYMTRFLEITCGEQTHMKYAEWAYQVAHLWGKEPTLLKKDIRGFVTNRLMYAVYREEVYSHQRVFISTIMTKPLPGPKLLRVLIKILTNSLFNIRLKAVVILNDNKRSFYK